MRKSRPARRGRPSSIDAPSQRRLPVLLRRAWYGLNQVFRRRVAHLGVTPDQCSILRWLHECSPEGLTQRQLGLLMCSDPNTIAALLARMGELGLVMRQRDEQDGRCNLIRVTLAGRKLFRKTRPIAVVWQREALAAVPDKDREIFLLYLEIVGEVTQAELARTKSAGAGKAGTSPARH